MKMILENGNDISISDNFNRAWDITKEINENICHYNDYQTHYPSMASHWLLGAFAAIGFVLISKLVIPFDPLWLVFSIVFVAFIGVYQLWRKISRLCWWCHQQRTIKIITSKI